MIINLRSVENKWRVLDKKTRMKGTEIRIKEDKTYREKKVEWRIRRIVEEKGKKGKKVRIGKERIWIKDRWFYWLNDIEDVKDEKEKRRSGAEGGKETAEKKGKE